MLDIIKYRDFCRCICDISHDIKYPATVMTSLGFYFEKKMHVELLWRGRQLV